MSHTIGFLSDGAAQSFRLCQATPEQGVLVDFALQLFVDGLPLFPGGYGHFADAFAEDAG